MSVSEDGNGILSRIISSAFIVNYYCNNLIIFYCVSWYSEITSIISGVTEITIFGFNFGKSVADVISVRVKDRECSSITFVNENEIKCRISASLNVNGFVFPQEALVGDSRISPAGSPSGVNTDEITLICTTGSFTGVHLQPETVARGASKRLVISDIMVNYRPSMPYAGIDSYLLLTTLIIPRFLCHFTHGSFIRVVAVSITASDLSQDSLYW